MQFYCSGSEISKCYIKHEARRAAGMRGPGRERLSLIPQRTIFCLTMPGRRTRARRKASNGFIDNYDWDPIGDLIPRGSPPPSPHHAAAASEDAPSTGCERRDFLSQMPFDVILEVCTIGYHDPRAEVRSSWRTGRSWSTCALWTSSACRARATCFRASCTRANNFFS